MLGSLDNGNVTLEQASYTTAAVFSCDVGYSLLGAKNVTCQTDGTWSDVMPSCGKCIKITDIYLADSSNFLLDLYIDMHIYVKYRSISLCDLESIFIKETRCISNFQNVSVCFLFI